MRRALRIVLWIGVFAACFGVGAYVAAHTDPFPPGVEDPGARLPSGSSPTDAPTSEAWVVQIELRTYHELYVGGRCAANWRVEVPVDVVEAELTGSGDAMLKGELRCDESTAQVQADQVGFDATGTLVADELRFRLDDAGRSPIGAQDLSGLVKTLPTLRFRLPPRVGSTVSFDITVPDGDRGTYGAIGEVLLTSSG